MRPFRQYTNLEAREGRLDVDIPAITFPLKQAQDIENVPALCKDYGNLWGVTSVRSMRKKKERKMKRAIGMKNVNKYFPMVELIKRTNAQYYKKNLTYFKFEENPQSKTKQADLKLAAPHMRPISTISKPMSIVIHCPKVRVHSLSILRIRCFEFMYIEHLFFWCAFHRPFILPRMLATRSASDPLYIWTSREIWCGQSTAARYSQPRRKRA